MHETHTVSRSVLCPPLPSPAQRYADAHDDGEDGPDRTQIPPEQEDQGQPHKHNAQREPADDVPGQSPSSRPPCEAHHEEGDGTRYEDEERPPMADLPVAIEPTQVPREEDQAGHDDDRRQEQSPFASGL